MTTWQGYFAAENLALSNPQRATLRAELQRLEKQQDPSPAKVNHWRIRLDNDAAIYEAEFNQSALTVQKFKNRLGAIFGVDPALIGDTVQQIAYGPLVTFDYLGTDYVRFLVFGGTVATWDESHDQVLAYLAANLNEWENSA